MNMKSNTTLTTEPTLLSNSPDGRFPSSRKSKQQTDQPNTHILKKNLNVSASGAIYERASSRRQRHRLALMASSSVSRTRAVPLGRGPSRGPARGPHTIADVPDVTTADDDRTNGEGGYNQNASASSVRTVFDGAERKRKSSLNISQLSTLKKMKTLSAPPLRLSKSNFGSPVVRRTNKLKKILNRKR